MTATLERPQADVDAPATVEDFEVAKVSYDHPQVRRFIARFFEKMGIPMQTHPLGILWFALVKNETIHCVVGTAGRPDGSIEITDFYALPSHDGVRAGYLVLEFFRALVDAGRIPYFLGVMLTKNKSGQRHFEKFFGRGPASSIFIYNGAAS